MYLMMRIRYFLADGINFAIILILLIGCIVLASVFFVNTNGKTVAASENFEKVFSEYGLQKQKLENENKKYLEYALKSSVEDEKLVSITRSKFIYNLKIDGNIIDTSKFSKENSTTTDSKKIIINKSEIVIELNEEFGNQLLEVLPKNIIECGSIIKNESPENLIQIESNQAELEKIKIVSKKGYGILFKLKNINPGEIISLSIEPSLAKKLGTGSPKIDIIYSKEE